MKNHLGNSLRNPETTTDLLALSSLEIYKEQPKTAQNIIMENLNFVLFDQNSPFKNITINSLKSPESFQDSSAELPKNLEELIPVIAHTNSIDVNKLKNYLNAMRAISSSNPTAINDFFKYHSELISQNFDEKVYELSPTEDNIFFKKIYDIFSAKPLAFSEENLQKWQESCYCNQEIKDNLKDENYRFILELIKKTSDQNSKQDFEQKVDKKTLNLEKFTKDYLEKNINFLHELSTLSENKYGKFLLDELFEDLSKSNSKDSKFSSEQIAHLKDNFAEELASCKSRIDKNSLESLVDSPILKLISLIDDNLEHKLREQFLLESLGLQILQESRNINSFSRQFSQYSSFKFRQDIENCFNKKAPNTLSNMPQAKTSASDQSTKKTH
jgi:hypothetical protein